MVSFSWVEDPDHPSTNYQFTPTAGTIITGASTTITSAALASTEGINTGSWKGTLGDDNLHWVVAGENPGGLDMNLTLGGVQLNGANKLMIQTEFDLDATVLATEVQICDWVSNTSVDYAADGECTGGGWRTLNTRNASQVPVALTHTAGIAFQWHVHNGYWSTGTTGGTAIDTPLTNFINGSNEIKIRYYSTTNSVSQIAIDFLRVYPIVDPVYQANGFQKLSGGTVAGHYGNTFDIGNTASIQQIVSTGDGINLDVPGTAATSSNFYLTFGNVKTYTGMNTILVNVESLCSAATANLQYRFKIHNFTLSTWEDISSPIDCSATGVFYNFAKNNISMDDYMNGSDEIWVGAYSLSTTTTNIRIDSMYLILGTTNTDTNTCEITMGSTTAGSIVANPSTPGADRIQALTTDGTYMYLGGYDTIGGDNEWRLEKRNLSDGALVTAFGVGGATTSDPSTGVDQIFAIATTTGAIFTAGYDLAAGAGQWRIEKRDITDGTLETAFDTDGIIQTDPNSGDVDQITAIAVDDSYLYVTGYQDDDTGIWRTHKYDITTGALVTAFDGDGIATSTLAASGDERPQAIEVDSDYLYIAGYDNVPGNIEWRLEKRNKTTGALCISGTECAAGTFGVGGVATSNPSVNADRIYAMVIDESYIYTAGEDSTVSAADSRWRIEKRSITTGALDTGFDGDGIAFVNPNTLLDWVTSLAVDDTDLYAGGFIGSTAGTWRVDKRNKTTGATTTAFSSNSNALSDDGADDRLNALAVDGGHLYAGGYGSGPTDNQWMIEKRDATTGLRVSSGFGGSGDCTSTRDLDTTSDDSIPWMIRTQDESTNASSSFYGFDSDADATLEEASAATMEFSTVVPANATVSGIYWAGRAMSGSAGTARLAIRDYSGLTGTTGGRSLVGGSPAAAMLYNDPLVVAGVASGGMAGYMTNPEDYIDTVNSKMGMSLVTTSAGASTTNSVSVWDFAMVSFSWVEPVPVPVYSISITSDGTIQYGFIDLNTSSSTVGGDTQTATNNGSVNEKINVRSSNAIGGVSWLLASTVASDQYTHEFSTTTGASWTIMPDSSTYVTASPFVTPSGTTDFDFRLTVPTGTSDFVEKAITITVQAVAP